MTKPDSFLFSIFITTCIVACCKGFSLIATAEKWGRTESAFDTRLSVKAEEVNADDDYYNSNETIVTRELLQRALLQDPIADAVVKRKYNNNNKSSSRSSTSGSGYKILDNRDSLPFRVEQITPDPYTHPDVKRKHAHKVKRRPGSVEEELTMTSRLFQEHNDSDNDDNATTLIGDFKLDKLTTTGDLLEIGNVQYKVTKHKCQYKYVGGKRFVMVRKILQVKEVGRLMQEEYLKRQWEISE